MKKKKNYLIVLIFSSILSAIISYIDYSSTTHNFQASELPGQIGKVKDSSRNINNSKERGFLSYGPYIALSKATYRFNISYSSNQADGSKFDITTDGGKAILKDAKLLKNTTLTTISQTIEVKNKYSDNKFEVRVWYGGTGELTLHSINIERVFGYSDIKKYLQLFLAIVLLSSIFLYAYSYSKSITLFTLLLMLLILLSFIFDAYKNYYNYKEMTYKNMPFSKDIFGYYIEQTLKSEYVKITAPELKKNDNIDSFHIMIDKKNLDILNADLPLSGMKNYVDADLKINENKTTKVKVRYRGGSAWNWKYERKSLKIKFKKNKSYNMMRVMNFSKLYSLDMFIEPITQKVAASVGVLAPDVKTVKMFINGEYAGLYLYLEQIDESFLRKNKLMPGSIYSGDYSLKKEFSSYIGSDGIAKLWYDSNIWDKKASRNAQQKNNREDIELFIRAINKYNDIEFFDFANRYLGKEYYTYLALDILWGTHHHDYFHNHKIYFDPYRGKYIPISWDVRFWKSNKNKDNSYYPLVERIALNPMLEFKRDQELYRLLKIINMEYINTLMSKEKNKFMNSYLADSKRKKITLNQNLFPWKETLSSPQLTVATQKDIESVFDTYSHNLNLRLKYLTNMLEDVTVKYTIKKDIENTNILFSVDGNSPLILNYENKILYPGRQIINKNALNLDIMKYGNKKIQNTPQFYSFNIKTKNFNKDLFKSGVNAITGKKVVFKEVKHIDINQTDSIHPDKLILPKHKTKVLQGTIKVTKTLVFDKYTDVTIKPNTTFLLDANKSIYFYGKVTAIGTKQKPIKFIALDAKKPWGLVAVQGMATEGSKFHYCEFENGSLDSRNLINYTAPFNIHDTKNFEVKNSKIGKNFIGDDAMHIAYATGIVDNCLFVDARADALDVDISQVSIINNIFKNSGNDALDIMTTTMNASNNSFINTGDKGISVGECSDANISDSTFKQTVIGLEVKDKSRVIANNLKFINIKDKAINLYNKNKRYDEGGFLEATNLSFIGNNKITKDKKSEVIINE